MFTFLIPSVVCPRKPENDQNFIEIVRHYIGALINECLPLSFAHRKEDLNVFLERYRLVAV